MPVGRRTHKALLVRLLNIYLKQHRHCRPKSNLITAANVETAQALLLLFA